MQYYTEKSVKAAILLTFITLSRCSDITQQVFGDVKEGIVAAFGDFNSDELTDVFLIRDQMSTLEILYGISSSYIYLLYINLL